MIIESAFNFQEGNSRLYHQEHDFSDLFERNEMRRLAPLIQNSIGTALRCLNKISITEPDAIITGTGKGCISKTETFLNDIIRYKETALNPATFIQSTYNTVNGQIAIKTGVNVYSNTYVNQGLTFYNVLLDASIFLREHPTSMILAGTFEENTEFNRKIYLDAFNLPNSPENNRILYGDGISFFCLSGNHRRNTVRISASQCFHNFAQTDFIGNAARYFKNLHHTADTFYLIGANNTFEEEHLYLPFMQNKWAAPDNHSTFKQMCGEHDTADSFALYAGFCLLSNSPDSPIKPSSNHYTRCIIVNHFHNYMIHIIELEYYH